MAINAIWRVKWADPIAALALLPLMIWEVGKPCAESVRRLLGSPPARYGQNGCTILPVRGQQGISGKLSPSAEKVRSHGLVSLFRRAVPLCGCGNPEGDITRFSVNEYSAIPATTLIRNLILGLRPCGIPATNFEPSVRRFL
jgi:hypothetical protein